MKRTAWVAGLWGIASLVSPAQDAAPAKGVNMEWVRTLDAKGRYVSLSGPWLFVTSDNRPTNQAPGYAFDLRADPDAPARAWETLPGAWDIAVAETCAAVCDYTKFLTVYEMTPTNWTLAAKLDMPSMTENIIIRRHLAYVAVHNGGLVIVDFSAPAKPRIVGTLDPKIDADGIALWKDCAVLYGHWQSRLVLVDVSDPANPRQVGAYQHDEKTFIQGEAAAADGLAFAAAGTNGVVIVDIRDPANPKRTAVVNVGAPVPDVAAAGRFAFVAANARGVRVFDVKDPANPVEVGSYERPELAAVSLAVAPIVPAGAAPDAPPTGYRVYVANLRGPAMVLKFAGQ